jgi:hypothetical protein
MRQELFDCKFGLAPTPSVLICWSLGKHVCEGNTIFQRESFRHSHVLILLLSYNKFSLLEESAVPILLKKTDC